MQNTIACCIVNDMVKVHNVRLGYACNSSSTHSVVLLDPGQRSQARDDRDAKMSDFGWNNFTAASRDTKMNYLGHAIFYDLLKTFPDNVAALLVDELIGAPGFSLKKRIAGEVPPGHIDHQSVWSLPRTWDGKFIDEEFLRDMVEFLSRDDVVILGGNDNVDSGHPLANSGKQALSEIPTDAYGCELVARNDGDSRWTLFNRTNGNKVRMSFDPAAPALERTRTPELVDVKITSYCPFFASSPTCKSCYQGSNVSGVHASLEDITTVADALAKHRVFEVALGGGEPTLHPQFVEILRAFKLRGVTPNFTTRTLKWADDPETLKSVLDACGTFALSVDSVDQVVALSALRERVRRDAGSYDFRPVIQVVLGSVSIDDLKDIFSAAGEVWLPVTALGWKTTGRGGSGPNHDVTGWVGAAKLAKLYSIGVDTEALRQWRSELKGAAPGEDGETGLNLLSTPREGRFSAYWDVVAKKFGPSSFCDHSQMVDAPDASTFDVEAAMRLFP